MVDTQTSPPAPPSPPVVMAPITVPLSVFYVPGTGIKIGIQVSFNGAGNFKFYEFDTGAAGVFAAYPPHLVSDKPPAVGKCPWWPTSVKPSLPLPQPINILPDNYVAIKYSSGKEYTAEVFSVPVSFTQDGVTPCVTVQADVGCIVESNIPGWASDLNATPPQAPLYDFFFGDFGVSVGAGNGSLMSILPQMPNGLNNGFKINLGRYPTQAEIDRQLVQGPIQVGSLTLGLLPADMQNCTMVTPMAIQEPRSTYPNSGLQSFSERLGAGYISVSQPASDAVMPPLVYPTTFCFDTGAPTTEIHYGADGQSDLTETTLAPVLEPKGAKLQSIKSGLTVQMIGDGVPGSTVANWDLSFQTMAADGNTIKQNIVNASGVTESTVPAGYVNTGLEPFFNAEVIYNLAEGVIGFIPYPPQT